MGRGSLADNLAGDLIGIDDPGLATGLGLAAPARIIPQNMSVASRRAEAESNYPVFEEDLVELNETGEIAEVLESTGYGLASSMAEAVRSAADLARPGDTVLLSPACASFDWYANYHERGRDFAALVRALPSGGGGR